MPWVTLYNICQTNVEIFFLEKKERKKTKSFKNVNFCGLSEKEINVCFAKHYSTLAVCPFLLNSSFRMNGHKIWIMPIIVWKNQDVIFHGIKISFKQHFLKSKITQPFKEQWQTGSFWNIMLLPNIGWDFRILVERTYFNNS